MTSQTARPISSKPNLPKTQILPSIADHLPHYIICTGLGALSGAVGMAIVIVASILLQGLLFPMMLFDPGLPLLAVGAILVGAGVSLPLCKVAPHLLPMTVNPLDSQWLRVVLAFSTLMSIFEAFMFTYGP